jgi:L-ascorbate metabolism protein UlaG (beta-lactamase superfamily)
MQDTPVFLKSNVVLEPLIDRWYAWAHLISPATAAMNIAGRHLPIIRSFIQAPQIHAAAVKNPKMLGGPFMDIPPDQVHTVKALQECTLQKRQQMLALAGAIKELDIMLAENAKGYSLEPLYARVPELLKGYVELLYDLNGNTSFRFFESLLYKSVYYDQSAQSLALWITHNDHRPFVLSTPRLDAPDVLHLNLPFTSPLIDLLSAMKRQPRPRSEVRQLAGIAPEEEDLFNSFFTETPPEPYARYTGDKVRMRYFGHACILIETKELAILVDPLVSYYGYQSEVARYSDADLPEVIDYVLITHNHQDHVLLETLLPLRHKTRNVVVPKTSSGFLQDPNLKLMFQTIGFPNVIELEEMELITHPQCTIQGIPFTGEHCDLNIKSKLCYLVRINRFSILFAADSSIIEPRLYQHVHAVTGDVDVIMLGMECDGAPLTWVYGPLLTHSLARDKDATRRLAGSNCERGRSLVESFRPKEVYVYAMGQEPWLEFISSIKYTADSHPIVASDQLIAQCQGQGIVAERLFGEKELVYDIN